MTFTEPRAAAAVVATAPTSWYRAAGKRLVDLLIVIPLLLLALPVLALAALALRIKLGPGIVLRQRRIGRNATVFRMYKFRTMEHSRRASTADRRDDSDGPRDTDRRNGHKSSTDPRHTGLGRTLRKFSVDELPQLVNVLRGDMSLVGPRPQMADVASATFRAHPRHLVRPGLTGPFQVSSLRASGNLDAGLDIDLNYVEHLTFRSDLAFLFGTLLALVRGTGS